jgi:anaerobic ribonucleoside-triphosphate reductase activating protein
MKYVNTGVVFQEIPDEVTLSINISNCPCHCIGCHSKYLWEDTGNPLTAMTLNNLLKEYGTDITCICFMGGDGETATVNSLAHWLRLTHPEIHIGWYSGRTELAKEINLDNFDYIKLGPYIKDRGGLDKSTTNQKLYRIKNLKKIDITSKFHRKDKRK